MEHTIQLKKNLHKALNAGLENEAIDIIQALDRQEITIQTLEKTKIGLTVAKARKHENKALASEASKLISKWKKLVASPKQMSSSPDNGSASDPKESLKQEANGNGQKHETQGGHQKQQVLTPTAQGASSNGHPQSNTTPKQTNTTTQTSPMPKQVKHKLGDATRQRVLEMLTEGLGQAQDQDIDPVQIALEIESEMYRIFDGTTANYKAKFRELFMNLKNPKNPELRERVVEGHISPARLCQMTSQELASRELQEQRKALEEACLKEAIRGVPKQATTTMFRCHKCKKRECTFYQLQTRSADEPMTTFVNCTNCGNRWRC